MCKFYASYASKVALTIPIGDKKVEQPQLEKMLVRGFMVDISAAAIHRVLFGPNYIAHVSIVDCYK